MRSEKPATAMVTHLLDHAGAANLWDIASRLGEYRPRVITERLGSQQQLFLDSGIPVYHLPRSGPMAVFSIIRLVKLFRAEKVGLVHLNSLTSYYQTAAMAARWVRARVVWFVREDAREERRIKLLPALKKFASVIAPASHEIARACFPDGIPGHVRVIHQAIDPEELKMPATVNLRACLGIHPSTPIIGYTGVLEKRKGLHDLISALARLAGQGMRPALVCLGRDLGRRQSYRQGLEAQIAQEGLQDSVFFIDDFPNPITAYPQFDLFVLPSQWEGSSRSLIEAMAQRCPIITTQIGGNPEIITNQRTGLLIPPGDVRALAAAIQLFLSRPEIRHTLALNAHQDFLARFTIDRQIAEVREAYHLALGTGSREAPLMELPSHPPEMN